ncbi:C-type lectin domain family 2 member D11-like isoform X2 [Pelodiscus sinensis]|uniref:C-type lectin domain family 2 member D11-like isoform X2 n=1 Tax=Pelodiscus sinensis TaxID=13735 RepID=UPI003F6BE7DB
MLTSRPGASLACPSPPSWHSAGQQQQQPRAPLQPSRAARDIQRLFSGFWCRAMADNGAQTVLWKHPGVLGAAAVIGAAVVIIIALAAALGVERSKQPPPCPPTSGCPENWIRIQGKFYYFSKAEGNWTNSQKNCSSHAASLATIESLRQLHSLLPYPGRLDHWIGLRKDAGGVWRWVNGTEFDHRGNILSYPRGSSVHSVLPDSRPRIFLSSDPFSRQANHPNSSHK